MKRNPPQRVLTWNSRTPCSGLELAWNAMIVLKFFKVGEFAITIMQDKNQCCYVGVCVGMVGT